jgi:hypothetical protein
MVAVADLGQRDSGPVLRVGPQPDDNLKNPGRSSRIGLSVAAEQQVRYHCGRATIHAREPEDLVTALRKHGAVAVAAYHSGDHGRHHGESWWRLRSTVVSNGRLDCRKSPARAVSTCRQHFPHADA